MRQRFDAYGNVIPIFAQRLIHGQPITVYGDGEPFYLWIDLKEGGPELRRALFALPGSTPGARPRESTC